MLITWEDKLHDKMCQRIRKVADTKSSPSTLIQKSIVFKLFHSGERFQKVPFSWIFLCVLVWTEGVSVTIKLRFQIYPAWCGRGLSHQIYSTFCYKPQMERCDGVLQVYGKNQSSLVDDRTLDGLCVCPRQRMN